MALVQEIKVPLLSVNDITLTVVELLYATGQPIKKGDVFMVFETSKTTYDVEAENDGYIQYLCEPDHDYEVETVVARIYSDVNDIVEMKSAPKAVSEEEKLPFVENPDWTGEPIFSAAALSMIEARAVDKSLFRGKDFVNKADVERMLGGGGHADTKTKKISKDSKQQRTTVAAPTQSNPDVVVEKISKTKKREIEYLSDVQSGSLISMVNVTVETDGIFGMLNNSLKYFKDSLLPLVLYECARLLKKYPLLNAYYDGDGIGVYKKVNLGFAVDIGKGLKVLQIPSTNEKSIAEIEQHILDLSSKYLDDSLELSDLSNISFTVTDLSAEGTSFFFPLVNSRNSAILGISAIDQKLNRATLTLSFDHRVTEGKAGAQFLAELKDRLESYRSNQTGKSIANISCFKCSKTLSSDISDVGFVKCITPEGKEAYVCQSCFKGF